MMSGETFYRFLHDEQRRVDPVAGFWLGKLAWVDVRSGMRFRHLPYPELLSAHEVIRMKAEGVKA